MHDHLRLGAGHGLGHRLGIERVGHHRAPAQLPNQLLLGLAAGHAGDLVPALDELRNELLTDRARRAGNEHLHGHLLSTKSSAHPLDETAAPPVTPETYAASSLRADRLRPATRKDGYWPARRRYSGGRRDAFRGDVARSHGRGSRARADASRATRAARVQSRLDAHPRQARDTNVVAQRRHPRQSRLHRLRHGDRRSDRSRHELRAVAGSTRSPGARVAHPILARVASAHDDRTDPAVADASPACPSKSVARYDTSPTTHVLHKPYRVTAGPGRSQPVRAGTKYLFQPVIHGRSRSCRLSLYRSVTPEVAGSSPVAPVYRNACK